MTEENKEPTEEETLKKRLIKRFPNPGPFVKVIIEIEEGENGPVSERKLKKLTLIDALSRILLGVTGGSEREFKLQYKDHDFDPAKLLPVINDGDQSTGMDDVSTDHAENAVIPTFRVTFTTPNPCFTTLPFFNPTDDISKSLFR